MWGSKADVKQVGGMHDVAAQPYLSDDFFKSKRAAFSSALQGKTCLIFAKATAMFLMENLEPSNLGEIQGRAL